MKRRWWRNCVRGARARAAVGATLRATETLGIALLCSASAFAVAAERIEHLNSGAVLPTDLPFSEAVRVGDTVYLSGQVGIRPGTMTLVEGGMAAEARQTLENIRTTLRAHGLDLSDVVKCTVMLADIGEWGEFNQIYQGYFSPPYPARSALGANGLAMGARVELECLAVAGERIGSTPQPPAAQPQEREKAEDDDEKRVYRRPNAQ